MSKPHEIRILDLDAGRLMIEETLVKKAVRKSGIKARVSMVSDNLAIARQGLMDKVPAIELDGIVLCHSRKIRIEELILLFQGCK